MWEVKAIDKVERLVPKASLYKIAKRITNKHL